MKKLNRYIALLCALVCCTLKVAAQGDVEIMSARFEPQSVLLGDHFELVVEVEAAEGAAVAFPTITPEFAEGHIELLEELGVDTLGIADGRYHLRKSYRMISFDAAQYRLDSLGVLTLGGEGLDTLYVPHVLELDVQMMPVDTAQKTIYDIKQPLETPLVVEEFGGYVVLSVFALAVVASLVWLIARSLRREKAHKELPKEPAHVTAIRSLEMLSNQKLWQNGKVKEYWSRLTEIFRTYLQGRYDVGALEMTSDEIVEAMKELPLTPKQRSELAALLAESDLVKFAKHTPATDSHEAAYYTVYYFVEESKEVAEEVVTPEVQEPEGVTQNTEEEKRDE